MIAMSTLINSTNVCVCVCVCFDYINATSILRLRIKNTKNNLK